MKNGLTISSLTLSVALLTACGGGSSTGGSSTGGSSTGGSSTGGSSTGGTAGVNPVTPLTISESQTVSVLGQQRTTTIESGFEGDIEVKTETQSFNGEDFVFQTIQLANGVPSMNVTDLQKTEAVDVTCDNGLNGKFTSSSDFSSGVVISSGSSSEGSLSCTSTFQSILPTTITDESSIDDLLDNWGDDDDLSNASQSGILSSTCPQDDGVDEFDNIDPRLIACTGSILTNFIVTDDNNAEHKLSSKISFSF